jgi:hypothetical protein
MVKSVFIFFLINKFFLLKTHLNESISIDFKPFQNSQNLTWKKSWKDFHFIPSVSPRTKFNTWDKRWRIYERAATTSKDKRAHNKWLNPNGATNSLPARCVHKQVEGFCFLLLGGCFACVARLHF